MELLPVFKYKPAFQTLRRYYHESMWLMNAFAQVLQMAEHLFHGETQLSGQLHKGIGAM